MNRITADKILVMEPKEARNLFHGKKVSIELAGRVHGPFTVSAGEYYLRFKALYFRETGHNWRCTDGGAVIVH
jgi:hypothetical protein